MAKPRSSPRFLSVIASSRSPVRSRRPSRVDDDERPAVALLLGEVLHGRRHRLGDVRAHEQDGVGSGDVRQGKRHAPVHPEGPHRGGRSRRHAEAAVVVDIGRTERRPGELAQEVRLLVCEPTAAEDPHRVAAVTLLATHQLSGHPVERVVPGARPQPVLGRRPHQGRREPLGMLEQVASRPSLDAQAAVVGGERSAGDPDGAVTDGEVHAALQGTVRAVGGRRRRRGHRQVRRLERLGPAHDRIVPEADVAVVPGT